MNENSYHNRNCGHPRPDRGAVHFDTLVFNFVIAAITLIAIHEVFKALGFGRKEWPMYAVFVPYTLLIMLSSYQVWRRLVMPASF